MLYLLIRPKPGSPAKTLTGHTSCPCVMLLPPKGYHHQHNTAELSGFGSRAYSTSLSLGSKDMDGVQCNQIMRLAEAGLEACMLCMAVTWVMLRHASPSGVCLAHHAKPQFKDWSWNCAATDHCP